MQNPLEIAREALRQLALKKVPPTPDNYRVHYLKIAGGPDLGNEFDAETFLKELISALPRKSEAEKKLAEQSLAALERKQWKILAKLINNALARPEEEPVFWEKLIPNLLQQWDARQTGITITQKRSALERALTGTSNSNLLHRRLNVLIANWSSIPVISGEIQDSITKPTIEQNESSPPPYPNKPSDLNVVRDFRELCAFALENIVLPQLADDAALSKESQAAALLIRSATTATDVEQISVSLRRLAFRIEYYADDQREVRTCLLHLLQLLIDNIGELVIDDQWLRGQMDVLRGIVTQPLTIRTMDTAERRLKEVLYKQTQLKTGLIEAHASLKSMLTGFVGHLASFTESTGSYHDKIVNLSEKISQASNITQLEGVIAEVMAETRSIRTTTQQTRDELQATRERVEEAEKRVSSLEEELARASELVRHDQLTGALNRRGLEEVFDKEINRAQRRQTPLCITVIDIDNFKKLNDSLGHQTGDAALIHLVETIKEELRPQDTVARFGGEEFVILLPESDLENSRQVIVRVQRALTKKYFLHDQQRVLITFSAGVTELTPDDSRDAAIKRADALMYQAKNSGKNKVLAA